MNKFSRIALLTASLAGFSFTATATESTAPAPDQDSIVQHLQLSDTQISKIKTLHQQLEKNVNQIATNDVKKGALVDVIKSGKWNEAAVKKQLTAFSNIEQLARYYKVKYYFDLSQVLTPAQRQQVQQDLAQAVTE